MKNYIPIFVTFLLFVACAQQNQPLSGGPTDSIAPKLIYSSPKLNDTSFTGNEIILKFDEYFNLNNIDASFFSSPPFQKKPNFKIKGKKLIIKLNEPLKDSVTYVFDFGNSIVDFHEKNVLNNFKTSFSTYNQIDTLQVSGKVVDTYTHKPIYGLFVMLYDKIYDSIPYLEAPIYLSKTDSSGSFIIKNIKQKKYKIFLLEDLNKNYIFNEGESIIAFSDSIIKPWVETKIQFDTLDSGTVFIDTNKIKIKLKDTNNIELKDTLRHDTIIKTITYNYFPNNLMFYSFSEENAKQNIIRKNRDFKGLVKIAFIKPLIDKYFRITPLKNSDSSIFNYSYEFFPTNDSMYLWFSNKNFFNKDSLNFLFQFKTNDTTYKTDTIILTDYNYASDTLALILSTQKKSISNYDKFIFKTNALIKSFDTSKILLYQIIDTIVDDEKIQSVKVIRPETDSLIFIFERPIINTFDIKFLNQTNNPIPFYWNKNNIGDSVFCKITSQNIAQLDSIKFKVFFDNLYFFDQIQNIAKKFTVPITNQKVISVERKIQDSIIIIFNKNIPAQSNISLINIPNTNYIYKIRNNKLEIILKNKKDINTDSIKIAVSFPDKKPYNEIKNNFIDTINGIYTFDKQKTSYIRRFMRSKIIIAFKKPLLDAPDLKLLSFNPLRKWYSLTLNKKRDTAFIDINNQRVIRLNDMRLRISYFDINQHSDTLFFNDTVNIKIEKLLNENAKNLGREKKITVQKPIVFNISRDSLKIREYNIGANYIASQKYKLIADSAAFKDIFDHINDSICFDFNIFSPNNLASVSIDIKNIWAVLDEKIEIDTSVIFQLPQGQLILLLQDAEGNLYKKITFNTDKTIKDPMILPGKYTMSIIYDINSNNIWNTGNYIKHRQAEKVFIYKQILQIKESDDKKIIWDLADPKDSN